MTPPPSKALRAKQRSQAVAAFVDVVKERSYVAVGAMGVGAVLLLGAGLLWARFDGGSEYVVFDKAVAALRNDDEAMRELGGVDNVRFFGERSEARGHHAGLRHSAFVHPATGEPHVRVTFHWASGASGSGDVIAEMAKRRRLIWHEWEFVELSYTVRSVKGRWRSVTIVQKS